LNTERAILKGRLSDLKLRKMELMTAAGANIKAVKNALAAASVTPIEKIDLEGAMVNLKEAVAQKHELAGVLEQIAAIEAELA
jgi:hypothetical protein